MSHADATVRKRVARLPPSDSDDRQENVDDELSLHPKNAGNRRSNEKSSSSRISSRIVAGNDVPKLSLAQKVRLFLCDPEYTPQVAIGLLLFELVLCPLIINLVPYTEIDWQAYMDQVGMVHNGTLNYGKIHGRTGPLVYPAGFVWIFYALYMLTGGGVLVRVAQYVFACFYLVNLAIVLQLYRKTKLVAPLALMFMTFGAKRVHSIFLLRMFNDPVAMLLAYAGIYALMHDWPVVFCALYSLSVSVKMNTLLFAPAVLFILYTRYGSFKTIHGLLVCAGVQICLAIPFLSVSWWSYAWKAFEFQRKFMHRWTVNWRFLPEWIFMHWIFHVGLLIAHVGMLALAYHVIWKPLEPLLKYGARPPAKTRLDELGDSSDGSGVDADEDKEAPKPENSSQLATENVPVQEDSGEEPSIVSDIWSMMRDYLLESNAVDSIEAKEKNRALLLILFSSNLIGIAFARTLHYQFYSWYFHQLPFLLWNTPYPLIVRLLVLGVVEFCYLAYPSTIYSSALLHACHATIIVGLFLNSLKRSVNKQNTSGSR